MGENVHYYLLTDLNVNFLKIKEFSLLQFSMEMKFIKVKDPEKTAFF